MKQPNTRTPREGASPKTPQELLTVAEVVARTKLSERTVRRYLAEGTLKYVLLNARMVRVDSADVDALFSTKEAVR